LRNAANCLRQSWRLRRAAALAPLRLAILGTVGAGTLLPGSLAAQAYWRPDARVIISDFSHVVGIAVDSWRVTAATGEGLISYDPVAGTWNLPLTAEDGYPVTERPSALGWLNRTGQLLLGTWAGSLWRVDVEGRRFERMTQVPGPILSIREDAEGNAFLATGAGAYRLPPGSFTPEPARGMPARSTPDDPYLDAMRGQLGLDPELRRHAVTSSAAGRMSGEYWIGTDGGGIARVDTRMQSVEWLPFGMTTRGGGAIAQVGDRLWFGGDDTGRDRSTLASATTELQEWAYPTDRAAPRGHVYAIEVVGGAAWVATADGLYGFDLERRRWQEIERGDGLPSQSVTALAGAGTSLWAGTSRGLCRVDGGHCGPTLLSGHQVHALAVCGGRLWAATRSGLYVVDAEDRADALALPRPGMRVTDVACLGTRLFAAARDQLFEWRGSDWQEVQLPRPAGMLRTLTASEDALWIGSDAWAGRFDAASGEWAQYLVPADIPLGPIDGLLPLEAAIWAVTPFGMVRLDTAQR
jgi:ligand-binding sensor domain-containing protein